MESDIIKTKRKKVWKSKGEPRPNPGPHRRKRKTRESLTTTRNKTFTITAHGSSDMTPEDEIESIYNYICAHPGKGKAEIARKSASLGFSKSRFMARWTTIRKYLRNEGEANLNRLNPDGEPWVIGISANDTGRWMRYYATDKSLAFVPASDVAVKEVINKRGPDAKPRKVLSIERESPETHIEPTVEKLEDSVEPVIDIDMVVIHFRGCRIELPAGSTIRLE